MNTKQIVTGVVALVVAIVITVSCAIPVISDSTQAEDTFTNEGYARYTSIESTDDTEITIFWDHTDPKNVVVGTDKISFSECSNWTSIVFGQDWTVRYATSSQNNDTNVQYIGPTNSDYVAGGTTLGYDVTIVLDSGTATITNGETTKTATYTTAYYPDNNGSMIMKKSDMSAYLLKDSSIVVANGNTTVGGVGVGVYFTGTVDDGYNMSLYRNTNDTEVSNVVSNYNDVSGYLDLIKLTDITFDMTPDGGTATQATYSYFLVPYEVTAERAIHPDSTLSTIINVIPVLLIVSIIIGAVALFISNRRD